MSTEEKLSMSKGELDFLKHNRKYIRTRATNVCNSIAGEYVSYDYLKLCQSIDRLTDIKDKLSDLDNQISKIIWIHETNRVKLDEEIETCDGYSGKIVELLRALNFHKDSSNINVNSSNSVVAQTNPNVSSPKLPQIPLPVYSHGKEEIIEEFFERFETLVDRNSLTDFEKFSYLEKQLSNEPLMLIKSLQGIDRSYKEAKSLLLKAFSSPTLRKFELIKRLESLKLKNPSDTYQYIGEMRSIIASFKNYEVEVESILQYFIWHSMPDKLQTQFVHIVNKDIPDLQEIIDNVFEAARRFSNVSKSGNSKNIDSHSMAVNIDQSVTTKTKICILCSKFHHTSACDNYPAAKDKTDRLRRMGRCVRCSGPNHNAGNCKFKFYKPCVYCNTKNHFGYLCLSKSKGNNDGISNLNKNNPVHVNANCLAMNTNSDVVLPTFTIKTVNGNLVRILKDSGCTNCFIRKSLVNLYKCKVLERIKVNVNGMNVNQMYDSEVVEVEFLINNTIVTIKAITIEDISINLNVPKLGDVVDCFLKNNFKLADNYLDVNSHKINNVDFILGSEFGHILPGSDIVFGRRNDCMYVNTELGVMLCGSVQKLIHNLHYLKPNTVQCTVVNTQTFNNKEIDSNLSDIIDSHYSDSTMVNDYCLQVEARVCNSSLVSFNEGNFHDEASFLPSEELEAACSEVLNYETVIEDQFDDNDQSLIQHSIDNIVVTDEGRLCVPLLWNAKTAPHLPENFTLAKSVLESTLKKHKDNGSNLLLMDETISDQLDKGVITRVSDLMTFRKNNKCSFMAHMPIIKLKRETTKCRIVYLSNLSEKKKDGTTISHNTSLMSGACLNRKLLTAMTQMRCEKYLLIFDIVKAFLQIEVPDGDKFKLCFLWFKNVQKFDYSIVAYHFNRVPFGLKCSPFLLMISLYYILIVDTEFDSLKLKDLKRSIWNLFYVDNGAVVSSDSEYLKWAHLQLISIFSKYKFDIQQCITNNSHLQSVINRGSTEVPDTKVKLLGMKWDTENDVLCLNKITLSKEAISKRTVLQSIASNFDLFGLSLPILNRARLYMQRLQCDKNLTWDTELSDAQKKDWINICNQANSTPTVSMNRYIGKNDDHYDLLVFTDSSKEAYGCVLYIVNKTQNLVSFLYAKNRLVSKNLELKSIPCLELKAVELGVESVISAYLELSGNDCVCPFKIDNLRLYSDSLVALNWVHKHSVKFDKTNKLSVFVRNRLNCISNLCDKKSVSFYFCDGKQNPSDFVTREISYRQLSKTNFFSGLSLSEIRDIHCAGFLSFAVPCKAITGDHSAESRVSTTTVREGTGVIYDAERSSKFSKIVNVFSYVLRFINKLKMRLNVHYIDKYIVHEPNEIKDHALFVVLKQDQMLHFPEIVHYFNSANKNLNSIPPLVTQLNIFCDDQGILRVKCKLKSYKRIINYPVLLSKKSYVSKLLILHIHNSLSHAGVYSVLSELRKLYYIPSCFSCVKRALKECVQCKRINSRTIKLNQNSYKEFRLEPVEIPFRDVFLDYIGPMNVSANGIKTKYYLLIITCLWSRAISLQICVDMTVTQFLRAFQLHIFSHGAPQRVYSDLGSNLVAGGKIISDYLNDTQTKMFFSENQMKPISFQQYSKGCSKLGSLVESCVKIVKKLIFGTVRNLILKADDFFFLIAQIVHLVNRRPIAFKEALRDCNVNDEIPSPITPELLLHGRELVSLNIVPELQNVTADDTDWSSIDGNVTSHVKSTFDKLMKVRAYLTELYHEQFVPQLIYQSVNVKDRYKPVVHKRPSVNDIVILKDPLLKPSNFPLAIVTKLIINDLDEVTAVEARKGCNREIVRRHVDTVIPLLTPDKSTEQKLKLSRTDSVKIGTSARPKRIAALECESAIRDLMIKGCI